MCKARSSEMVEGSDRPRLRRIGPFGHDTTNCLPFMVLREESTTFGRNPGNDYHLDSRIHKNFISRWHSKIQRCQLANGEQGYKIYDTSLNGTFVNDYRVNRGGHVLNDGDKITFGHLNGSNIGEGNFAQQPKSLFQYVFDYKGDFQPNTPESYEYKLVWKSPCCKKGKECTAKNKGSKNKTPLGVKLITSYFSPKSGRQGSAAEEYPEKSAVKCDFHPVSPDTKPCRNPPEFTLSDKDIFMVEHMSDSGIVNDYDSDDSDITLLDRVKLAVESFGDSDSDIFESSDSD